MTKTGMQELFLPVHKYVEFLPQEIAIINLPAFQRLRRCRQLGFAHLLFPGATHTRFEHSLGTLHVAQRIIDAVNGNCKRQSHNEATRGHNACEKLPIDEPTRMFIRLSALLHDIGHIPFGHTFEDELNHLDKHDSRDRIDAIADTIAPRYTVNPALQLGMHRPSKWMDASRSHR